MSIAMRGIKRSDEGRARMSEAQKRRTPEHQEKLTASKRGKVFSPEHIANLSAAHRGRKHTPETKEKMKAAWIKRRADSAI